MCPVSQSLHQQRVGARSVGEKSISHRGRHDPQSSARHRAHARLTRRASEWPTARRLLAEDEDQSFAGARSTLLPLLHSWRAIAGPSLLVSMQLSSRGPSGPEHRARLLSWKDHPRRGRYGVPTRRAGAIRDRHRTPPPPPPSTSIRYHAYGEKGTEGRARRAGARHPRQGDRSGRTSAVVLASAARLRGRATTRSPCRLHGLLPASPRGPHEVRHARRPRTLQEETPRPAPPRRPPQARHDRTMGCPQWGESGAWRPGFRALRAFTPTGTKYPGASKAGLAYAAARPALLLPGNGAVERDRCWVVRGGGRG